MNKFFFAIVVSLIFWVGFVFYSMLMQNFDRLTDQIIIGWGGVMMILTLIGLAWETLKIGTKQ